MSRVWHEIIAPAKVNLCLQVLGKRGDGYHDLLSLAGFTSFGDRLSVSVCPKEQIEDETEDKLDLSGDFAPMLVAAGGDSLCQQTAAHIRQAGLLLPPLHIKLEKNIPLGGGLGGGSADAAALLRLIAEKILPGQISTDMLYSLARDLGADVPVCLYPNWQIMTGTGTVTRQIFPPQDRASHIYAVLANPLIHISTAQIFADIASFSASALVALDGFVQDGAFAEIIEIGNDLLPAACKHHPEIYALITALNAPHDGFIGAGMSGSGASCFALTTSKADAENLAINLQQNNIWAHATKMLSASQNFATLG